jgi:hypothetical protein
MGSGALPVHQWTAPAPTSDEILVGARWGGEMGNSISMYALSSDTCKIRVYLEDVARARFRGREAALYPLFTGRVRRMLRRAFDLALRGVVSDGDVGTIVDEEWPADLFADHPHLALYRPRAERWTRRLATLTRIRGAQPDTSGDIRWRDSTGRERMLELQLVGRARVGGGGGQLVAVALSSGAPPRGDEHVNWSKLRDYQRLPFALLEEDQGGLQPMVFYGDSGELRHFRWRRNQPQSGIRDQLDETRQSFEALATGQYAGTPNDWTCDRCPCRIVCPAWMGDAS